MNTQHEPLLSAWVSVEAGAAGATFAAQWWLCFSLSAPLRDSVFLFSNNTVFCENLSFNALRMKILCLLVGAGWLWWARAARVPALELVNEELQLATDEGIATRAGSESYAYQFPNPLLRAQDGTTMNAFGVQTTGDFTVHMFALPETPRPQPLTITKTSKGWDAQYLGISRHYEDSFDMPSDKFVWFIIERTNSYMALYRAQEPKPILIVSNHVFKSHLNFNTLQKFKVSSTEEALWDFQGYKYDLTEQSTRYPFLDAAVEKVRKSYETLISTLKRCEYAQARVETATDANNEKFFLIVYLSKNCREKAVVVDLRDAGVKYKALLLVAGVTPPPAPDEEKCRRFIMDKRSLRF